MAGLSKRARISGMAIEGELYTDTESEAEAPIGDACSCEDDGHDMEVRAWVCQVADQKPLKSDCCPLSQVRIPLELLD
jgi:hypothetical protein